MDIKGLKAAAVRANSVSLLFGLDARRFFRSVYHVPRYVRELQAYRRAAASGSLALRIPASIYPILGDYGEEAGVAKGHYFHQDLWAARKICKRRPSNHLDVGSRIDGFVAHVLSFMPVAVIDVRPLQSSVSGLSFVQEDATSLSTIGTDTVESLSSLHAVEHFGLGRYGDPLDPSACFSAMASFKRVLRPGGRLYFSVPIGIERLEFNAQRVFAPDTILRAFAGLDLVSFAAVDDRGSLDTSNGPNAYGAASFSCGLFEFTKPAP